MRHFLMTAVMICIASLGALAQPVDCWFTLQVGTSMVAPDNNVKTELGLEKDFGIAGVLGFEFGFTYKNLDVFIDISEEEAFFKSNDRSLKTESMNISLNFAYPFYKNDRYAFAAELGLGTFLNDIKYGGGLVFNNLIYDQKYNLYIPAGVSMRIKQGESHSVKMGLYYRHSIETGSTKLFGGDKVDNFPLYKLNSLLFKIGYVFAI